MFHFNASHRDKVCIQDPAEKWLLLTYLWVQTEAPINTETFRKV